VLGHLYAELLSDLLLVVIIGRWIVFEVLNAKACSLYTLFNIA
jgi:hypothetical protein